MYHNIEDPAYFGFSFWIECETLKIKNIDTCGMNICLQGFA